MPVPAVLRAGSDRPADCDYLLMSELPGSPWHGHGRLRTGDRERLRYELGTLVAEPHTVTGSAFGYPEEPVDPLNSSWRAAFLSGYRAGGGQVEFGEPVRRRLRLYRIYLYLIMVVEATPRGYAGPEHDRMHRRVTGLLRADLDALDGAAPPT